MRAIPPREGMAMPESIADKTRQDLPLDGDGNLCLMKYCWEKIKGSCNKGYFEHCMCT